MKKFIAAAMLAAVAFMAAPVATQAQDQDEVCFWLLLYPSDVLIEVCVDI